MEQGLPWVRVKLAMSLDGRTAMASGESKWITGEEARADVQRWRAASDAILTGIGTVLADDPSLNVRLSPAELGIADFSDAVYQPKRVVLDSRLQIPLDARLLKIPGDTLVCTAIDNLEKSESRALQSLGAQLLPFELQQDGRLPLQQLVMQLAQQEINEIHVEAGATLCGALIQQNLVDELIIYMAPSLMGSSARGLLDLPGLERMTDKIRLQIKDMRAVGDDWRIRANIVQEIP